MTTPRPLPVVTISTGEHAAEPSRRQFCAHACQAASLVAVGALLPACGGGGGNPTGPSNVPVGSSLPILSGTVAGRTVTVPVAAGGPLSATGNMALVTANLQPTASFLVARTSDTTFNVLTAVCTHEACTVDQSLSGQFLCSCHGSRYTTGGAVANGPATRALQTFPSTFAADVLTFTA